MKAKIFLTGTVLSLFICSCVSTKKYSLLDKKYNTELANEKICADQLKSAQSSNADLIDQKASLLSQIDYLKKNSTQALGVLEDMSVLSSKQAESVKQSLENLSKKDSYINNLQSAMARKDSLNMNLVMNLKSSLADVNDKDITVKVEKGVVYIDISDKLLFNSGEYIVTDNAKLVLGKVASVLDAHPDIELIVEGHTDSIPIHTSCINDNWDLSVRRATSVVRVLENQYNISPVRMTAAGHSKFVPLASNDTPEGRALNRRTRIIIIPQLDQFFKLMVRK